MIQKVTNTNGYIYTINGYIDICNITNGKESPTLMIAIEETTRDYIRLTIRARP